MIYIPDVLGWADKEIQEDGWGGFSLRTKDVATRTMRWQDKGKGVNDVRLSFEWGW